MPEDYLQVRLRRQDEQILALARMVFEMKDKINTILEESHLKKELARSVDKGGGRPKETSFKEEHNKLEDPRASRVKKVLGRGETTPIHPLG